MSKSFEAELSRFILLWNILGPLLVAVALVLTVLSWPDRWLGCLILLLASLVAFYTRRQTRLARRALVALRRACPEECLVQVHKESGDSRDYYRSVIRKVHSGECWEMFLTTPTVEVDSLLDKELRAEVHFDPDSGAPLVIEYGGVSLWAEHSSERLKDSR